MKNTTENADSLENEDLLENEDPLEKHGVRLSFQDQIQINQVSREYSFSMLPLIQCHANFMLENSFVNIFLAYYDLFLTIFFPTFCPTFSSNCFSIFFLTFFPPFCSAFFQTFFLIFSTADHIYQKLILELKRLNIARFDS